ncbi:hypothetical protein JCM9279_007535 [Rhodotorula babjevae]
MPPSRRRSPSSHEHRSGPTRPPLDGRPTSTAAARPEPAALEARTGPAHHESVVYARAGKAAASSSSPTSTASTSTFLTTDPLSRPKPAKRVAESTRTAPRPANAWILYRSARAHEFKASEGCPAVAQADISKVIGQLWRDETPEVRRFWELEAQRAKARHRELYPGYVYRPVRRAAKKPPRQEQLPPAARLAPPPLSPTELPCVLQPVPASLSPPRLADPPLAPPDLRRPRLRADLTPHLRSTDLPTPTWQPNDLPPSATYFPFPSAAEPSAAPPEYAANSSPWSAEDAADLALGVAALDAGGGSSSLWATPANSPDAQQQQPAPSAFEAAFYPSPPPSTTLEGFDHAWLQSVFAQQEAIELPYQY